MTEKNASFITLLTDFGDTDGYAGSMKGVIFSLLPGARVVDISHHVSPYHILSAAYVLKTYYRFFPRGTAHVVVVDPGVGGERKCLVASAAGQYFAAPDNGTLSYVIRENRTVRVREIANPALISGRVSPTFHGRDILAPAAARLAAGEKFRNFGPAVKSPLVLDDAFPQTAGGKIRGKIVHIDHFGALITSITREHLRGNEGASLVVHAANRMLIGLSETYSRHERGELVFYFGSSGHLELAAVEANASLMIGANPGDEVCAVIRRKRK